MYLEGLLEETLPGYEHPEIGQFVEEFETDTRKPLPPDFGGR